MLTELAHRFVSWRLRCGFFVHFQKRVLGPACSMIRRGASSIESLYMQKHGSRHQVQPFQLPFGEATAVVPIALGNERQRSGFVATPWPSPKPAEPKWVQHVLFTLLSKACQQHVAVGQNRWYHFGVGAPLILVYFSGDWDVHWGYGSLTHGHVSVAPSTVDNRPTPQKTTTKKRGRTEQLDICNPHSKAPKQLLPSFPALRQPTSPSPQQRQARERSTTAGTLRFLRSHKKSTRRDFWESGRSPNTTN